MESLPNVSIGSDEYKHFICEITGDECNELYCGSCEIALEYKKEELEEEKRLKEKIRQNTGQFIRKVNLLGIKMMANQQCTIGRITNHQLTELRNKDDGSLSNVICYSPDLIKKQYPEFEVLKEVLHLDDPIRVYAEFEKPAIIIYPDVIYVIAPRPIDEEDEDFYQE